MEQSISQLLRRSFGKFHKLTFTKNYKLLIPQYIQLSWLKIKNLNKNNKTK